jgi:DNA repair protein RadC
MVREGPVKFDGRIRGPKQVAELATQFLEGEPVEVFGVAYLNTQYKPIHIEAISRGILDASLVHPREVFRGAILTNAAAVILFHNHPSGETNPSREDIAVTRQIKKAGEVVGIPLLDHIIIDQRGGFYSLEERGCMHGPY